MVAFLTGVVLGAVACILIFRRRFTHRLELDSGASAADLPPPSVADADIAGRLKAVVDTAVDGIITIDEVGTIQTVNPATERIFGYASQEMIGNNVRMLMPEPYRSEHDSYLARYHATGERRIIGIGREVLGRRKDGSQFPIDLAVSETALPGRRFYTGMIRDITERKRAEEALLAAKEEAERANRAKDQFLAVMSHELRTPLNAIVGYADLMDAGVYGEVTSQQYTALTRIKASARHLIGIIEQVLTFARSEKELHAPRYTIVRIADLVAEVAAIAEPLAVEKNLKFRAHAPAEDAEFETDDGMIRQILINLVGNAIKFTDYGEVLLSVQITESSLWLRVADTGRGILPEFRERIFEPFWQMDRSHTRAVGGSGLGLTVTRRLVNALHGEIGLESEPRRGTVFTVAIPAPDQFSASRILKSAVVRS